MGKSLTVLTKILIITGLIVFIFNPGLNAATCTVTTGNTHQTIQGFGASNAWSDCTGCIPGSAKNAWFTGARLDDLFTTNGTGIGLSIIRMRIPPDAGQFGSAISPVQGAAARGALVMATAWTPPTAWKTVNQAGNSPPSELQVSRYQDYANYLKNFVNVMKTTYNVDIYALSPANEPDYQVTYDGCDWTGNQLRDFVKNNLGPTFDAAPAVTAKIVVGESFRNAFTITDPTLNDAIARGYTDIIAEHTYGGGPTLYPLCQTHNKDYWVTERSSFEAYDGSMTHGLVVAGWLHSSLAIAEFNAYIYWWLASDANNEGLTSETQGHPKRYYIMGNYSKFIRPGFVRIDATAAPAAGITCSAYRNTGSTSFVFLATNTNSSAQSLTYSIPGVGITSVTPYVTDASNNLAAQAAVAVSGNSFTYNLPARSVVSFVGNMPAGTPTRTRTATPYAGTPTFTPTGTSTPSSILLDDMEDGNNQNNWGGDWYSYSGTGTTITPKPFVMTAGGMTGSPAYRAQIQATVADYAGMGTNLNAGGTAVDLTAYTAVEFWVKGNGTSYWFHFTQADITSGDYYGVAFATSATWTKITVPIDQASLGRRGFGGETVNFAKNAVVALQWTSNGNGALDIQVDNVQFLSSVAMTPTRTPTRTPTVAVPTGTFTRTRTPTYTRTPTPVNTATYTRTRTVTPANTSTYTRTNTVVITLTFTRTVTPVNTSTFTRTPSGTFTRTNTVVITPTFTRTVTPVNTSTSSVVPTATYTRTRTVTPVNTFTATSTRTSTPQNTPTFTRTRTNTPVNTSTYTRTAVNTSTNTPVNTFTSTRTASTTASVLPTNTYTRTPTPSFTLTITLTYTLTFTRTNTPVYSPTHSPTGTPPTPTFTPTVTNTHTSLPTGTFTRTGTPTGTYTRTSVPTNTYTRTSTPVPTATRTFTLVSTQTSTPANTSTSTPVNTATNTMIVTATNTPAGTLTNTPVQSPTFTATIVIPSVTYTPSATASASPLNTNTRTPTLVSTMTSTGTPSVTFTGTLTSTLTYTPTRTATPSFTPTLASTLTFTPTRTATPSFTITVTFTSSRTVTPTFTRTVTATVTLLPTGTPTFTPTIVISDTLEVIDVVSYPNPYKGDGDFYLSFDVTKQADKISFRVYTTGFRKVLEISETGSYLRKTVISMKQRALANLANGVYYGQVIGEGNGEKAVSKPYLILILK